jgi:hypothetical protein
MEERKLFSKVVASIAIFGAVALLFVGAVYDILTPREWAIGMLVWFAALLLFAAIRKRLTTRTALANTGPSIKLDDRARTRILRRIWIDKVWIGVLAVCLPIGIANGVAHHAWLPTITGVTINLLLMYVAIRDIRQRRTLLGWPPESRI